MKRKGGPCDHPRCERDPLGCRAWAEEEFELGEEDIAYATQLIKDGWRSTSTTYRRVSRLKLLDLITEDQLKDWRTFVRPEFHAWIEASGIAHQQLFWQSQLLRSSNPNFVEHRELTFKQFRAFKKLGGPLA